MIYIHISRKYLQIRFLLRSCICPSILQPSTKSFMRLIDFKNVLFPQPEGPIIAQIWFSGISILIIFNAWNHHNANSYLLHEFLLFPFFQLLFIAHNVIWCGNFIIFFTMTSYQSRCKMHYHIPVNACKEIVNFFVQCKLNQTYVK